MENQLKISYNNSDNSFGFKRKTIAICGTEARKAYRRKRTIKKQIFRTFVLSVVLTVLTGSVLFVLAKEPSLNEDSYITVTVQSGDTLWTIAQDHFPEDDPRDVICEIRQINDISDYTIYAGEDLLLPVYI